MVEEDFMEEVKEEVKAEVGVLNEKKGFMGKEVTTEEKVEVTEGVSTE